MVEIAEYEKRGDLAAPFKLTKQAEKAQREAERIRDSVRCDVLALTWEQYVGGEPCPDAGEELENLRARSADRCHISHSGTPAKATHSASEPRRARQRMRTQHAGNR